MFDLNTFCDDEFSKGNSVILLPSQGIFSVDGWFKQENTIFSHKDSIEGVTSFLDATSLNEQASEADLHSFMQNINGSDVVGVATSLTGITKSVFLNSDLAIVTCNTEESDLIKNSEQCEGFLKNKSIEAFNSLNIIRFIHCDLFVPDRLPNIPGYWDNSDGYIGAFILNPNGTHKIIAGREMGGAVSHGLGIGLESDDVLGMEYHPLSEPLTQGSLGAVGEIIKHALKLYSRAMYSNSETLKFITVMALFEYLGTGGKYTNFKKVRAKIQAHIATDIDAYNNLSEQFQLFTSKKHEKINIGYRTRIIHEGALIEDLLPDNNARVALFRDLTIYIEKIIRGMYPFIGQDLSALQEHRQNLLNNIGIQT
ncbi:MAG: hypothetical protein COC19_00695 [SAR86 cluster bacterium]|uniref:Apea-like HEPN domain-containing protein n=1 Tax=SAR86 cluster bacterium TaxID=2030880 RepID=A0A2A4MVD6_9GAMM|nr:MAG: hypothetical protein COC19_00695 [SAR86 cluster bacterium]